MSQNAAQRAKKGDICPGLRAVAAPGDMLIGPDEEATAIPDFAHPVPVADMILDIRAGADGHAADGQCCDPRRSSG